MRPRDGASDADRIAVAYVGVLAQDGEAEPNTAFSQAGQLFQERLLAAVADAGIDVTGVLVQRPVPSYPAERRLRFKWSRGTVAGRFRSVALPFINYGPVKTVTASAALLIALLRWGRSERSSRRVIVYYNGSAPPGLVAILGARLMGATVIGVIADVQVPGAGLVPNTALRRAEYRLQLAALTRSDGLVVLTHAIADDFAPGVPHIQMEGAVPTDAAGAAERTIPDDDSATARERVVLMYSGGLSEMKGTPLLLEAMRLLQGDEYRLWITGDGPSRPQVEAAAATDARIEYRGFAPYASVRAWMGRATVLVNPHSTSLESSRYVFPSKLLEYLATGTPVISTVSSPEVAREYGESVVLLDEATPGALADAVRRVAAMSPEDRARIGAAARDYVLREKSWAAQGARIARFIRARVRELAATRRSA